MSKLLSVLLFLFCLPELALSQVIIEPGGVHIFASSDNGGTECQTSDFPPSPAQCLLPMFFGTNALLGTSNNQVIAKVNVVPPLVFPSYARAFIYNDFNIEGSGSNFVEAQISVTFDYDGSFAVGAAYLAGANVSLSIEDLNTGHLVASHTMFEQKRAGDQGFSDVAVGEEREQLLAANSSFRVLLRRGVPYRLYFTAEAQATAIAGAVISIVNTNWEIITIRVDEDEVELLATHDEEIKADLAEHDADIKELLYEVIRLLLTPPGRRNSDFIDCDSPGNSNGNGNSSGNGCDFPASSGQTQNGNSGVDSGSSNIASTAAAPPRQPSNTTNGGGSFGLITLAALMAAGISKKTI